MNKRLSAFVLAAALASSLSIAPASALEYDFSGDVPGRHFYAATTVGSNAAADSGTIIVGPDGTIGTDPYTMPNSSPLSTLDIPAGEFPDTWGYATDLAIARTSVFPNAFAPPTQWSGVPGWVAYDPYSVYGQHIANPQSAVAFGAILPTALYPMPAMAKDGAIGQLQIPSIELNQYIYEGTSQKNLMKGVAHFESTSGWNGNVALAGHNRPAPLGFWNLKNIHEGDLVYYTTAYGTRTYQVSTIGTCATTDTTGLVQDGTSKLTMYTCKAGQPEIKLMVVATLVG